MSLLSVMVIPTPTPIEEYEAFQFTVENAEAVQIKTNAALIKEDVCNARTWRLIVIGIGFVALSAKLGDWIVQKGEFYKVYDPEEFHRTFTITSAPGRPHTDPANKTIQANPGA